MKQTICKGTAIQQDYACSLWVGPDGFLPLCRCEAGLPN